ncbi:hypothetical protein WG954_14070 [Lacibacter sp. H375]|uniref:hypothetical protein n=1 Tax=Lacibacter sp. H375 TaxID=3133424 RepID=UPI0030C04025
MKKISASIVFSFFLINQIMAQLTPEERIQDSIIGWYTAEPKKATTPFTGEGKTFSVKQQENLNEIIRWMRQTYTPVGGLGTHDKKLFITAGEYRPIKRYPPHSYGIDFRVWNVSYTYNGKWLDAKGHFKPVSEEYTRFDIEVNTLPGTWPISWINNDDRYVFTWEEDKTASNLIGDERKKADPKIHPNLYPWLTWQNKQVQSVFLVPGNKLPIVAVTKGELLQMAEESFEILLKELKMTIEQQFGSSNKVAVEKAYEGRKKVMEKHLLNIQKLKAKHSATLNEPAIVDNYSMNIYSFETDPDPFVIREVAFNNKDYYRVYKYSKELLQKCKTDQPQWLNITVPYTTKTDGNQEYEMYKSVIENFNYEYAYNYFFNPDKVKGKPYTPANEQQLKARLDTYRKKGMETVSFINTSTSPNVLLADDFSINAEGTNAKGWKMSTSGEHSTITTIKNETGKWLKLGYNNTVTPFSLKKPLPQNFSISFDIVTDDFSSRSGGTVKLYLSTYPLLATGGENKAKDGAYVQLTIGAGNEADLYNNNYRGEAKLELHTNPPLFRENFNEGAFYTKSLTEFTNKKRKVQVKLSFNNGEIQLFINNTRVAVSGKDMKLAYGGICKDCRIPAGLSFNTISWENFTSNSKETGVYISNIKVTKG